MPVTMSFEKFYESGGVGIDEDGINKQLYVVRTDQEILYVGISKVGIYHRWFEGAGSHIGFSRYGGEILGRSSIGQIILDNRPMSMEWSFDFWTLKEGLDFLKIENILNLNNNDTYYISGYKEDIYHSVVDIKWLETWFIRNLHPRINGSENICVRDQEVYSRYFEFMKEG